MEITEVRIKLMEESEDRLRAFCSITIDHCFVVRDLKIIEGTSGPFVAMPSRKLTGRCGRCGYKNHLRSNYCNQCGTKMRGNEAREVEGSPNKLYADIAHPIRQSCRDLIQDAVVREYELELQRAKLPGYVSRYDDDYLETAVESAESHATPKIPPPHFGKSSERPVDAIAGEKAQVEPPHLERPLGGKSDVENITTDRPNGFGAGILDPLDDR